MKDLSDNIVINSEQQFLVLVNSMPDSVSQLDSNFRYLFVNKTIQEISGRPADYFVGKTIYDFNLPDYFVKEHDTHLKNAFKKGETTVFEAVLESPKNRLRTYHMTIVPVWNADRSKVETVMNIAKDITEQKEFERELNDSIHELQELSTNLVNKNRQLQDFAYIVAHNLRSPMNNLLALMDLQNKEKSIDQKDFLLKKIGEVAHSFSRTIEELTEVVKIRQEINIEFQTQKFEDVVEHIKTMLNTQIANSNAHITCDFSACETIRYPKVYLESILLNLITNSIKYRSEERDLEIHLSSKVVGEDTCFFCEDNGVGMDLKEYGNQVFGMNKTFHRNPDSRGMGLFITRNQLQSLGGSISVDSEPDKGAVFSVIF